MYAEVVWVLVSAGTQVQPQIIPDPDYLSDYLSVSYDYAKISSVKVEVLQVTWVGDWISCFKLCIVQNWCNFLASANASFVQTVLFSWTIYL